MAWVLLDLAGKTDADLAEEFGLGTLPVPQHDQPVRGSSESDNELFIFRAESSRYE